MLIHKVPLAQSVILALNRAMLALEEATRAGTTLVFGYLGGAPLGRASLRVTVGGALAMAVTALIGRILGVAVG